MGAFHGNQTLPDIRQRMAEWRSSDLLESRRTACTRTLGRRPARASDLPPAGPQRTLRSLPDAQAPPEHPGPRGRRAAAGLRGSAAVRTDGEGLHPRWPLAPAQRTGAWWGYGAA